jgi:hypothetical protein
MKLATIKTEWEKYIVLKDKYIIDIIMATLVGNLLVDSDPIWLLVTAPSSGGKTTMIAPCVDISSVFFIDDVSEKTFLSGYKIKGKDVSLLKMMGSGIMIFSDFTSILSKNIVSRGEILSQMKLIYDGKLQKYTGTGGVVWQGKMGVIACSTPDIYSMLESGRSTGERFCYYWLDVPSDDEITMKQEEVSMSSKQMTDIMKWHYKEYFDDVKAFAEKHGVADLNLNTEQKSRLRKAAMFCVNGKTTIHTNFKNGKVDQIPNKASAGRDSKMFGTLLRTLQLMYAYEKNDHKVPVQDYMIDIVEKSAYSSINRERRAILEILAGANENELTATQIGNLNGLGLEKEGVACFLAPLFAVGLVKRSIEGNAHKWYMPLGWNRDFILKTAGNVPQIRLKDLENIPEEKEDDEFNNW